MIPNVARPDLSLSVEYNSDLITSGPIEVLHGANLTLSCIDHHAFPPPSFQWFSNGAEISNTDLSASVETIGNNQSQLALYNVQGGSFTLKCTATNSVGTRSRMITVSVLSKCIALICTLSNNFVEYILLSVNLLSSLILIYFLQERFEYNASLCSHQCVKSLVFIHTVEHDERLN